jgi:hypothetical protein
VRLCHAGYRGWDTYPGSSGPARSRGPEGNIIVTGENGDTNTLVVCEQDLDCAVPREPVTLEVASDCFQEDDSDKKCKKKRCR